MINLKEIHIHQNIRNFFASLMIVVVFLTGCNGQNILDVVFSEEPTTVDPQAAGDEIQQENAAPAEFPAAELTLSNNISIWLPPQFDPSKDTESGKIMLNQIASFKEQYPEYEVDIRVKAASGPSSVFNMLLTTSLVAQNALPSIVLLPDSSLQAAVEQGIVQPIEWSSIRYEKEDWYPFAIEMSMNHDDVYGIPFAADAISLISKLGEIGGEYKSLEEANNFVDTIAFAAGSSDSVIPPLYYQSVGGVFTDDQGLQSIEPGFMMEMLTAFDLYRKTGVFPKFLIDYQSEDQLWDAFVNGELENVIAWSSLARAENNEFFISPVPGIRDNAYTYARGWVWCLVSQQVYHADASILFIEHMTAPSFLSEWTPRTEFFPVRPSSVVGWNEPEQAGIDSIMQSASLLPNEMVLSASLKSDMIKAVQDVLQGISSPEESTQMILEKIKEPQNES